MLKRDLDGQPYTKTNQPCTQTGGASLQRVAFLVGRSYKP